MTDNSNNIYRDAYDRLETHLVEITGNMTATSKPAVLAFPDNAEVTAEKLNDAISNDEFIPTTPYIDDEYDNEDFYYASSRIYRPESTPDITVRADEHTLRVFENPYEEEEPLAELSFGEFQAFIERIEETLGITFQPDPETEDESE